MGNLQANGSDHMADRIADTAEVLTLTASAELAPYQTVVDVAVPASTALVVTLPPVAQARGKRYIIMCRSIGGGGSLSVVSKGDDVSSLSTITLTVGTYAIVSNIAGLVWQNDTDIAAVIAAAVPVAVAAAVAEITPDVAAGVHTGVADDDSAGTKTIDTGLTTISTAQVMALTAAGVVTGSDMVVTFTGGNLTIADGSTYKLTAGHLYHWLVTGT